MVKLLIIHPTDPFGRKVAGDNTFIRGLIKYAPEDFDIFLIGISSDRKKYIPGEWLTLQLDNKKLEFLPLFYEPNENRKSKIPVSLRFTLSLKLTRIKIIPKSVLFFNRMEPAILFRRSKLPKIGIVHSDIQKQLQRKKTEVVWSYFPWLFYWYDNLLIKSFNSIYTASNNTFNFYQKKYPERKDVFHLLPTWVDTKLFSPSNESKYSIRKRICLAGDNLPYKGNWILYVGRLQKEKEPIRLINSFYEYQKRGTPSFLIIIGEGNLKKTIEEYLKRLGIENNVFIMGAINHELLPKFYRAADVLLLTSNYEGMPLCVLEALACGLPVVSTDVGEVRKVIKNNISGEVVDTFSLDSISRSLEKVLRNPNTYSKNNCINAVSEYTPQKVLRPVYEKIRELYRKGIRHGK